MAERSMSPEETWEERRKRLVAQMGSTTVPIGPTKPARKRERKGAHTE
jgi:hypothetical protein